MSPDRENVRYFTRAGFTFPNFTRKCHNIYIYIYIYIYIFTESALGLLWSSSRDVSLYIYLYICLSVPFSCNFLRATHPSYYTLGALRTGGKCRASIVHAWSRRVDAWTRVRVDTCTRFFVRVFLYGFFVRVFVRVFLYGFFCTCFCTRFFVRIFIF